MLKSKVDTGATGNSDHVFSSMMMMRIGDYDDCGASGGGQGLGSGTFSKNYTYSILRILLWFHPHYRKHCHRVDDQEKPEEEGGRSTNSNWI